MTNSTLFNTVDLVIVVGYFAVALGFVAGTYVARRFLQVSDPIWYWPAPILLGVIGVLGAGLDPALRLPEEYSHSDTIPAWALVRPLPVEMVGVGLLVTLWLLRRPTARDEHDEGR